MTRSLCGSFAHQRASHRKPGMSEMAGSKNFGLRDGGGGIHVEQVGGCAVSLHAQPATAPGTPAVDTIDALFQELGKRFAVVAQDTADFLGIALAAQGGGVRSGAGSPMTTCG